MDLSRPNYARAVSIAKQAGEIDEDKEPEERKKLEEQALEQYLLGLKEENDLNQKSFDLLKQATSFAREGNLQESYEVAKEALKTTVFPTLEGMKAQYLNDIAQLLHRKSLELGAKQDYLSGLGYLYKAASLSSGEQKSTFDRDIKNAINMCKKDFALKMFKQELSKQDFQNMDLFFRDSSVSQDLKAEFSGIYANMLSNHSNYLLKEGRQSESIYEHLKLLYNFTLHLRSGSSIAQNKKIFTSFLQKAIKKQLFSNLIELENFLDEAAKVPPLQEEVASAFNSIGTRSSDKKYALKLFDKAFGILLQQGDSASPLKSALESNIKNILSKLSNSQTEGIEKVIINIENLRSELKHCHKIIDSYKMTKYIDLYLMHDNLQAKGTEGDLSSSGEGCSMVGDEFDTSADL